MASNELASTPWTFPSSSCWEAVYAVDKELAATEMESATHENKGCVSATRPPPGDDRDVDVVVVVVRRSSGMPFGSYVGDEWLLFLADDDDDEEDLGGCA